MIKQISIYILTFISFLIIDLIWLGFIAKNLYSKYIGDFLSDKPNLLAATLFYILFVFVLLILVVYPAFEKNSIKQVFINGALFGMICYATYDLTNLATFKNWPLSITIIDIIWGTVLSASVSLIGYYIVKYLS